MAIDLKKIESLYIDEGTESSPFILTEAEVTTLYKLAISNNNKIVVKGYVNTVSGTILKYQSYQIKKAWSDIHVLAREVSTQDWTIKLLSSTINEGGETRLIATNIALETLKCNVRSVSCDRRSPEEIKPLIHFDNSTGRVYFDKPTSNAGWTATIILEFWPEYIENPTAEDYRTVQIVVRAIAVDTVTVTAPTRIDESAEVSISLAASPVNNTKGDKVKFSLQTTYGTISPVGRTELNTFTYFAPSFAEIVEKGGTVPVDEGGNKYFNHEFIAAYYMFDVTEPSGTRDTTIKMQNAEFSVTCETDSLIEGEKAEFFVNGYTWDECQKTMVIDATKLKGIDEDELKKRVVFENGPFFSMYNPIDNMTFSADVKLYIAPPGAAATGDRAISFDMHLEARGITSLTLSPQTIGQNIQSIITLEYKPANHTKGTLTFDLSCSQLQFISKDDANGIYKVFSSEIATEGHEAIASIYSSYIGTTTPVFSKTHKIYVQDIYFNIGFNPSFTQKSASFFEGKQVECYVDILHLSEFRKSITVDITQGADKIDEDWILERLHFSDTTDTDLIWFDSPKENLTFSATVTIQLIAKYVPEGTTPPYSQTISVTCNGIEVSGVEFQDFATNDNYQIAVAPYRKNKFFVIKTLPYNNTKQIVLESQTDSPFSISSLAGGLTMNPITPWGKYSTIPNDYSDWVVYGYVEAFKDSTDFGKVTKNLIGSTSQSQTPSTTNIVYPKNLTLYTYLNEESVELRKINDIYKDTYVVTSGEESVTKTIYRKVGKLVLSSSTIIGLDSEISYDTNSICFYITISDKTDIAGLDTLICSHFKSSDTDIRESGDKDTIINYNSDQKAYIRISLDTIGITDPSSETEETLKNAIKTYIVNQYNADTPITIYYPLANETSEEYSNTLYYDNIFFESKPFHIYTANNPANQCSVEFVNNSTIADDSGTTSRRIIFGQSYPVSDSNNKIIESMTVDNVRAKPSEIVKVKFFSGAPTSIDQYDEDGELLVKEDGTAEKGEVNIWENFSGKYEEWTDNEPTKVTWDVLGSTTQQKPVYNEDTHTITPAVFNNTILYSDSQCENEVDLMGYTWDNTLYADKYLANDHQLQSSIYKLVFTGTENISYYSKWTGLSGGVFYAPSNCKCWGSPKQGSFFSTHFTTNESWHLGGASYPITCCNSGASSGTSATPIYMQLPNDLLGTTSSSTSGEIAAAFKAYFKAQYEAGTPVTFYFPTYTPTTTQDKIYYAKGSTHTRYTISKLINEDDTDGDTTKTNKFNRAFVFNKDGSIPSRFFLSRFIPGWNQNDNTSVISMAKGLKSQQRTITKDVISEKGCYYKNDSGELQQVDPIYYGPLLAYTWLSYLTYGSINLKNSIGVGASKTSAEAQIYADDAGSPLTPEQQYGTLYILNNGLLNSTTYQNYDFNIFGTNSESDIAKSPINCYRIKSIDVGDTYSAIELANESGDLVNYKAKYPTEYYSLNSCFSTTGYSETHYLESDNTPAISGYGTAANKTKYNNNRHPVRCLNVENMWGGGDYTVNGTGFIKDSEDNTIVHPILWNHDETDTQSLDDINTWEVVEDLNVVTQSGTWDIGSVKYKNSTCAWPYKEAGNRIPYRGYNVYSRPEKLRDDRYNWVTGNYYNWSEKEDYSDMCGLGQTSMIVSEQTSTVIKTETDSYQLVEYIENIPGRNAYIKSGFGRNRYVYDIQFTDGQLGRQLMGNSSSNPFWGVQATTHKYEFNGGTWSGILAGNRDIVEYDVRKNPMRLLINNNLLGTQNYTTRAENETQVFALTAGYTCYARLYSLKVYDDNDALVGNMLPCYRISDNKPGLYDTAREQFLTSANTSEFLAGVNSTAAEDEDRYFKNTGLEIKSGLKKSINTTLKSKQNLKISIDFKSKHSTSIPSYFGGSRNIEGLTNLNLFISTDNRLCCENGEDTIYLSSIDSILPNTRHAIEVTQNNGTLTAKLDGVQTYTGDSIQLDTDWEYWLFTVNNCGLYTTSKVFSGAIYSFDIYKNNKLSRGYIPVYDKKDESFGLYDTVNKKYSKYSDPGRLPNEYQEVEYLQSTGTQYIDTNIIPATFDYDIEFQGALLSNPSGSPQCAWGYLTPTTLLPRWCLGLYNNAYLTSPNATVSDGQADKNEHTWILRVYNDAETPVYDAYMDGTELHGKTIVSSPSNWASNNLSIYIGARHGTAQNTAPGAFCKVRINNFRIKKAGVLIQSLIPCYRKYDNKPGMYDLVSGAFYTNVATTGEDFIVGPDNFANNLALQSIDSVRFETGQYIDTGWKYKPDSSIKITAKKYTASANTSVFGNAETNNALVVGLSDATNHPYVITGSTTSALTQSSAVSKDYSLSISASASEFNYAVKGNGINTVETTGSTGVASQSTSCFLGGYRGSDGSIVSNSSACSISDCQIYEGTTLVHHFVPVYNLVDKEYGMYDNVTNSFYSNAGTGILLRGIGEISQVEYIENYDSAIFSKWNFDTEVKFKDTSKITVDLDVDITSSDGHNKCINGSLSTTTAGTTYLSYSDNIVGGVSLIERTVDGSKVTWSYNYSATDDATIHISAGASATDSGKLKFRRVTIYGSDGITILKDYIPVKASDTAAGFYDVWSGQTILNSGDGGTIIGPLVSESVPGDPGLYFEKVQLLTRIFGTL